MEDAGKNNEFDDWLSPDDKKVKNRKGLKILTRIWKIFFAKVKILLVLLVILLAILQIPYVQTFIAQQITPILSKKLGFPITVRGVDIQWFDEAKLYNVHVNDKEGTHMIGADVIKLDFSLFSLVKNRNIYLDQVVLSNADIHLIKRDSLNMSQFVKAITALSKKPADSTKRKPQFHIANAILDNVRFSYSTAGTDTLEMGRFDHNHFYFENIAANLDNFKVSKDTISMRIKYMNALEERSSLRVRRLSTNFQYCNKGIIMDDLYVQLNNSTLRDSLAMRYQSPAAFSDFNNRVRIYANLKNSILDTDDLVLFAPALKKYNDKYTVTGQLKGTVSNLLIKKLDATFGKNSHVAGKATFIGLPNVASTVLNIQFDNSQVQGTDLTQYAPSFENVFKKLGRINLDADFYGLTNNFVSKGEFQTALGYLKTDINLKIDEQAYKGELVTKDFELGTLINQEAYVGQIDMQGKITGTGLQLNNADFNLDATIDRFKVMDYEYVNITTDGHFQERLFEGELGIDDPNLKVGIDGKINFKDSTFNFTAQLDTISFEGTNLIEKSGYLKTTVQANFTGLDPARISGEVGLFETELMYEGTGLELDFLSMVSRKDLGNNNRMLILNSELFNFSAKGNFQYRTVIADAKRFLKEITVAVSGDDSLQQNYYNSEDYITLVNELTPYSVNFDLRTKKVNKLLRLFDKKVYVAPYSTIKGEVSVGTYNSFKVEMASDTLLYDGYETFRDTASITIFKHVDSVFFNSEILVASAGQDWDGLKTKGLRLFSLGDGREQLQFNSEIQHGKSNDKVKIEGTLSFLPKYLEVDLAKTSFRFLNEDWRSTGQSQIFYKRTGKHIRFNDLVFSNNENNQYVKIDGIASEHPDSTLIVDVNDLDLGIFSTYIGKELKGKANIDASVGSALGDLKLNSEIHVDSIVLAGYELGNLGGTSVWDNNTQKLDIDASLNRKEHDVVKIDGTFSPKAETSRQLNVRTVLDGASLKILEPFMQGFVSDIDGTAIGILKIKGSPKAPILKGDVFVYRGKFKVNYLNTTYYFSDRIRFKEDFIGTKNLLLRDKFGQKAYLNGGIYHNQFSNLIFQLDGKLNNFMALNTEASDNALYYGTAIGTGSFGVFGPPDNIEISVKAKTERGTKIYIPLDGYASVADNDFIKFVVHDSLAVEEEEELNLKGIKMDFDIEITPDAYCEIIFDKKAGDIIRGNAQGKIDMNIDLQGEFTMFGDVEIVKGAYNFTLLNVVNKEFGVKPNSHISWSGDPYGAQLDITATYSQKASLAPIMNSLSDTSISNSPELRRGYPVEVLLNLKGQLLSPDITFGINILEYPNSILVDGVPQSLESYVAAFRERMKRDEQELNRQVFSLIVLKRLSPENTFSGISQSAGSSVSELLTNQLSYWVSQVDENLEIDVDLNSLGPDALNTFQLRLSYTFLDGRLRVSREGGVTNGQNEADPSSLIGDWTIEYLLTPDGKLRAKMYRKQNFNATFNTGLENSTAGMSLVRTKSFNSFKELFAKKKEKKAKKKKQRAQKKAAKKKKAGKEEEKTKKEEETATEDKKKKQEVKEEK